MMQTSQNPLSEGIHVKLSELKNVDIAGFTKKLGGAFYRKVLLSEKLPKMEGEFSMNSCGIFGGNQHVKLVLEDRHLFIYDRD